MHKLFDVCIRCNSGFEVSPGEIKALCDQCEGPSIFSIEEMIEYVMCDRTDMTQLEIFDAIRVEFKDATMPDWTVQTTILNNLRNQACVMKYVSQTTGMSKWIWIEKAHPSKTTRDSYDVYCPISAV